MSSILRIMRTTCVASKICCFFDSNVSTTCCAFMSAEKRGRSLTMVLKKKLCSAIKYSKQFELIYATNSRFLAICFTEPHQPLVPLLRQSIPKRGLFVAICLLFTSATVSMGGRPEFSASARGMASNASPKALMAYCSSVDICKGFCAENVVQIINSLVMIFNTVSRSHSHQATPIMPVSDLEHFIHPLCHSNLHQHPPNHQSPCQRAS